MASNNNSEVLELFLSSGIDKRRAEETLKNPSITEALKTVILEAKDANADLKNTINVLYLVATTLSADAVKHRPTLVKYVASNKIDKNNITPALNYLKKVGGDDLNVADFEKECGVGVVITKDEIKKVVAAEIESRKADIVEQRYHYPLNPLMAALKDKGLKWANQKDVKDEVDAQMKALLGEKTEADNQKPVKKKEPAAAAAKTDNNNKKAAEAKAATKEDANKPAEPVFKELITFPDPSENKQARPDLLEAHLKATKGVVMTRFPPEPNGYLHIGHAKSMNLNFSYPMKSGGYTYLRYDDTNPEAEKLEYIESIEDDVRWLGHKPWKVTFSSDYFPELYDLAVKLIKVGKAYCCFQTPEQIAEGREKRTDSPWRNTSVEENLKIFQDMTNGKYDEGQVTLRMKMDMQSDNPVMRDLIAYRIKYSPHPHVGDRWCVYPSYDYTHCLVDSLENITHSLCTLEFERRRESYNWLIDSLGLYRPLVWEYSRLNITNTVLSKRKLIRLVNDGHVKGWDDPRLPTIRGFRRRGYTPEAINDFCDRIGVTRTFNLINYNLLEQCVREDLDVRCNRAMAILEPIRVVITNFGEPAVREIEVANHPKETSRGTHKVPLTSVVYIESSDFRMQDIKGYKRLAPNKEVGLAHVGCAIKCNEVVQDKDGKIVELKATVDWTPKTKPKGFIHWVAEPTPGQEPYSVEVRLYDKLFKSEEPGKLENWLEDLNPNSLQVISKVYVDPSLKAAAAGSRYQFERNGYFYVDPDTTANKAVWNRIVGLKEANWEGKEK